MAVEEEDLAFPPFQNESSYSCELVSSPETQERKYYDNSGANSGRVIYAVENKYNKVFIGRRRRRWQRWRRRRRNRMRYGHAPVSCSAESLRPFPPHPTLPVRPCEWARPVVSEQPWHRIEKKRAAGVCPFWPIISLSLLVSPFAFLPTLTICNGLRYLPPWVPKYVASHYSMGWSLTFSSPPVSLTLDLPCETFSSLLYEQKRLPKQIDIKVYVLLLPLARLEKFTSCTTQLWFVQGSVALQVYERELNQDHTHAVLKAHTQQFVLIFNYKKRISLSLSRSYSAQDPILYAYASLNVLVSIMLLDGKERKRAHVDLFKCTISKRMNTKEIARKWARRDENPQDLISHIWPTFTTSSSSPIVSNGGIESCQLPLITQT